MVKFYFNQFDESVNDQASVQMSADFLRRTTENEDEISIDAGQVASAAVVSSAIVSTIVAGSLSQLWGLINGMKLMIYMRLLSIYFPDNASWVISNLIPIANFELPYLTVRGAFFWLSELPDSELDSSFSYITKNPDDSVETVFVQGLEDLEFNVRFMGDALGTPYMLWLLSYPVYLVILIPSIICKLEQ